MTILSENQPVNQRGTVLRFPNPFENGVKAPVFRAEPGIMLRFPPKELALARLKAERERVRLARQWALRDRPKNRGRCKS